MSGEYDPRITAYFGDAVMRAGFMPVPHLFMRHYRQLGLSSTQAMFLLQVMESAWDLADAPRTVGDLARRMGVDPRTIRKYSEEVAQLQLLELYDQFDATGAQVENRYDLSPLFRRLAELAPEPTPATTFRRRQPREQVAEAGPPSPDSSAPVGLQDHAVAPGSNDPPLPRIKRSAPPPDQTIRPTEDRLIRPPRIRRSDLKGESRIQKNHQEIANHQEALMHDAAEALEPEQASLALDGFPTTDCQRAYKNGWSLRWEQPLTTTEVQTSSYLLQRIGIDQPVRQRVAPSLAPAEVWALWLHAEAKRWRVPLTVTQIYNKAERCPQVAADLDPRHDAVGRRLAVLDPTTAEAIIKLVGRHCPREPQAVLADPLVASGDASITAATRAVWSVTAELRGSSDTVLLDAPSSAAPRADGDPVPAETAAMERAWQLAMEHLQQQLPPNDYLTWLSQARLVELADELAFISTPNIFVRDELEASYMPLLQTALHAVLGRPVTVHLAIGAG